ncbi:MAG: ABC transporter permease [Chloroflexota bacterium]|nr:ABC transporter permease [Chloroflexia bacterium]MDQ3225383.1 ABC transporter permease [Chloroflexota bacterium]
MSTESGPIAASSPPRTRLLDGIDVRSFGIVLSFLALFVVLSLASDKFLTRRNLLNILDQSAPVGIVACGVTIGIIAGVFDLSVGAIFAVAAVAACKLALVTSPWVGIGLGLVFGALLGIVNGVLVNGIQINSFIATLASSIVFRGIAILVTGGLIVTVTDETFSIIGTETLAGAKYTVWVFAFVIAIASLLMTRTTLGRYFYAVGGNARAARLSGIPVARVRTIAFIISGLCAGMAGVLAASRTSSAQPDLGMDLALQAIAASVVGGTSIMGGQGAIWRAVLGVLILAMIGNGFNLLGIDTIYQQIVQGLLIVVAVGLDQLLRRRQ